MRTKKFRLRPKMGLRSVLILLVVLSIALGYFARLVQQGEEQASILEELWNDRHLVSRKNFVGIGEPTIPSWLGWLPGSEHCATLENYNYSGMNRYRAVEVHAKQLVNINKLTSLKKLALWRTDVTHQDLAALDDLKQLELLDVHQCPNLDQDALVAELHRWPKLRRIILGPQFRSVISYNGDHRTLFGQGVSNVGLAALVKHPNKPVRELRIRGFNRRSMGLVLQLPQLTSLEVNPDPGTDPQLLNCLAFLPNLKTLQISGIEKVDLPFLKEHRKDILVRSSVPYYKSLRKVQEQWGFVDTLKFDRGLMGTMKVEGYRENESSVGVSAIFDEVDLYWANGVKRIIFNCSKFRNPVQAQLLELLRDSHSYRNRYNFPNLEELVLRNVNFEEFPTPTLRFDKLTHLAIIRPAWNKSEQEIDLSGLPELRSLSIETRNPKLTIKGLKSLKHLRRLYWHTGGVNPREILGQLNPETLEELDFGFYRPSNQTQQSEGLVEELSRFKNLKTCFFRSESFDWHIDLHAYLPNLSNFAGRIGRFDPAEERFEKAYSQLNFEWDSKPIPRNKEAIKESTN